MRKYVILGYIFGIGGWQTYVANKLKLMEKNGWEIYGINNGRSPMEGDSLDVLVPFQKNNIYSLSFPYPSEIGTKNIESVYSDIKKYIQYNDGDEIVFEATLLDLFMWAELLAKHFHGRALCVEVSNRFNHYSNTTLDFFHFKQQRGELLMMSKTGLHELFDGYIEYPDLDTNTVGALTQNAYADDGKDYAALLKTNEADFVVGTVGWLNKGYYEILIDEVIKFANQNPNKKVQFIVVGASTKGNIEQEYKEKSACVPNLILNMMGSIAPVPSNLVQLFDVAVASYGCAQITDKLGVTTISMHDPEYIPLGILSYTITETPFNRRINHDKTISDMLNDILIDHVCDKMERKQFPYTDVSEQEKVHLQRMADLPREIVYYDVESLPNSDMSRQHKVKVLFQRLFGMKLTEKVFLKLKG